MRHHPISEVTERLQYRAIGLVRGIYLPEDLDHFSKGAIFDENNEKIESVVLGRALGLIKRCLSIDIPHLWVVYPRCRDSEQLHLQISGIWEPSTLDKTFSEDSTLHENPDHAFAQSLEKVDEVEEGDDYFSIRGELIYTKPETKDLVVKIRQKPRKNSNKNFPFKLKLKGEIPLEYLRNFVSLDVRRKGQILHVEDNQILGPIKTKNNSNSKSFIS